MTEKPLKPPVMPENCCGLGCQDCVWFKYSEDLNAYLAQQRQLSGGDAYMSPDHMDPLAALEARLAEQRNKDD